jgi:hypothetical protein
LRRRRKGKREGALTRGRGKNDADKRARVVRQRDKEEKQARAGAEGAGLSAAHAEEKNWASGRVWARERRRGREPAGERRTWAGGGQRGEGRGERGLGRVERRGEKGKGPAQGVWFSFSSFLFLLYIQTIQTNLYELE